MQRFIWTIVLFVIFSGCTGKNYEKIFTVKSGDHDIHQTPVFVDLDSQLFDGVQDICLTAKGKPIPAQLEQLSPGTVRLWWSVSQTAGESINYGLMLNKACKSRLFAWNRLSPTSVRLYYDEQPLIQYEHPVFDPENIEETKKPFHHVYDPSGTELITKGLGGLFPHHRGIFFGYNRVFINGERIDIWHARNGERSEHENFIEVIEGPVMGGHTLKILWKDTEGMPFIEEIREIKVFPQGEGQCLIDFRSTLKTLVGPVRLEGDLQHAGVQFRAAQYVADNADETRFIRPNGWNHLDPAQELRGDHLHNLPWNAMYFEINGKPFTVAYLSHPENAERTEMSERRYGRFGEFFPALVTEDNPLSVHYRFWVKTGDAPSIEDIELKYQSLKLPPFVTIKK